MAYGFGDRDPLMEHTDDRDDDDDGDPTGAFEPGSASTLQLAAEFRVKFSARITQLWVFRRSCTRSISFTSISPSGEYCIGWEEFRA